MVKHRKICFLVSFILIYFVVFSGIITADVNIKRTFSNEKEKHINIYSNDDSCSAYIRIFDENINIDCSGLMEFISFYKQNTYDYYAKKLIYCRFC